MLRQNLNYLILFGEILFTKDCVFMVGHISHCGWLCKCKLILFRLVINLKRTKCQQSGL